MNGPDIIETGIFATLRQFDLFASVSAANLRELAKLGKRVSFPEHTVIFRNHEPAVRCYVITDGAVSLEVCGSVSGCAQILTVGNGELLGWSPLLGQPFLTATAKTNCATEAIEFDGHAIVDLCERQPGFGYQIMRCTALALAQRLTATRLQLLDVFRSEDRTTGASD